MFAILAVGTAFLGYTFFAAFHVNLSASFPSAMTPPRFLVASLGGYLLWFVLVATVFLGFDIASRERRERIADVLDSRPMSNLQLLGGQLIALVATGITVLLLGILLIQTVGALGQSLEWGIAGTLQPASLAVFVAVDALPALILGSAVVLFLGTVLRHRLLVALAAVGLLGLAFWALSLTPAWLLAHVALAPDRLVSDMLSSMPGWSTLAERLCLLLIAAGLLAAGAALLPRPDLGNRVRHLVMATVLVGIGGAGIAGVVRHAATEMTERSRWQEALLAVGEQDLDIESLTGQVVVDPGRDITVDVELAFTVGGDEPEAVFRLNPGMRVQTVGLDRGPTSFSHEDGLLRVELPDSTDGRFTLSVHAAGVPDPAYAYLDSAMDHRTVAGSNPLYGLGIDGSIVESGYVALMPGSHWLPDIVDGSPATGRTRDFRSVDLAVRVPPDWLVAGPGRREEIGPGHFRFSPPSPIASFGLLASGFDRRAVEVDGIEFEILLSPAHASVLDYFNDAGEDIVEALSELLDDLEAAGLPYPYRALALVEVPARLRGYGGGWQMPSTLALPGMLLLRERGFPTSRFPGPSGVPFGLPPSKIDALKTHFQRDRTGSNPYAGIARNVLLFQAGTQGSGAVALEYVCQALVARLFDDVGGSFSAGVFATSPSVLGLVAEAFTSVLAGGSGSATGELYGNQRTPEVWERAIGSPLADLDSANPALALNVLAMKGDAVASSILDGIGREATARLLAGLRLRYSGRFFDGDDFHRVAADVGSDLSVVGDWLHDSALPGFLASNVETTRLADDDRGEPRYQIRLHLYNGEPVAGLVSLRYRIDAPDARLQVEGPVRVAGREAVELGLVTRAPIRELWVAPYLSLNRQEFPLRVPDAVSTEAEDTPPLMGSRPSVWRPTPGAGIVVDDLDPGFAVRPAADLERAREHGIDQGLPVYQRADPVLEASWSRQEQPTSWGRYRHTIARVSPGAGDREARFSTTLPVRGRWRLDFHLPNLAIRYSSRPRSPFNLTANIVEGSRDPRPPFGRYDLRLVTEQVTDSLEFDGAAAEPGWNTLGRFELDAGPVTLVVTNRTEGRTVVADAIRWTPDPEPTPE